MGPASDGWLWHPPAIEFCDTYGVPADVVEAAAERPTSTAVDPLSATKGYPVEDRRRGDVTAIVGLRDAEHPSILYVRIHLPGTVGGSGSTGSRTVGGGDLGDRPRTLRGVKARIVADGYSIVAGGAHDRVVTRDGTFVLSMPRTPSDHRTVPNVWHTYLRAKDRAAIQQRLRDGTLLDAYSVTRSA